MGKKKIDSIIKKIIGNMDFLIGSVVKYRLKCGKNCTCNKGKKHICFYLSIKENGKTKNLYLPPKAAPKARRMSQKYKKIKTFLKEISQINYEKLKKDNITRKPHPK